MTEISFSWYTWFTVLRKVINKNMSKKKLAENVYYSEIFKSVSIYKIPCAEFNYDAVYSSVISLKIKIINNYLNLGIY